VIDTATPGYSVVIYARFDHPIRTCGIRAHRWVEVGAAANVHTTQSIKLYTAGRRYRYYLVWITSLGPTTRWRSTRSRSTRDRWPRGPVARPCSVTKVL